MKPEPIIELYRHDFRSFIAFVFRELYPEKVFVANWHIDVIADRLMRCSPGGDQRLMINVPPRYLKSLCASIAWPLFLLARNPGLRICVFTGTRELASDFTELRTRLLQSSRFQRIFPNMRFRHLGDALRFYNGAELVQTIVHRSQLGRGADIIIIDDPISAAHVENERLRSDLNHWYHAEIVPRLNNKRRAAIIVVMQRLHHKDLCAHLSGPDWERVKLAAIAAEDEEWELGGGERYRRASGEVLCEGQEDRAALRERLRQLGGRNFYAQYLQVPLTTPWAPCEWGIRGSVAYDGWEPGMPFARIPIFPDPTLNILDKYFGERPPYWRPGMRKATEEEWGRAFYLHQTRLLGMHRHREAATV